MTAPRIVGGLTVHRNLPRGLYLEATGSYTRAFRLEYLESDRWQAGLVLGCNF